MAKYEYFVDINGKVTRKKIEEEKKTTSTQKTTAPKNTGSKYEYFVDIDGNVTRKALEIDNQLETTAKKKEEKVDFFKKGGLFEDGWDFGDGLRTLGLTIADASLSALEGLGGMAEGILDLGGHIVAGGADLLGADNFADDLRKVVNQNTVSEAAEWIRDIGGEGGIGEGSVLGKTTRAVGQGVGQIGGILLTGGIGSAAGLGTAGTTLLTSGTMFASSAGAGVSEAYNDGANDAEAWAYGTIKGGVDAASELIFGGLGKGVKALGVSHGLSSADDILAKKLSSKISSKVAKTIVQAGVKASGEGLEEVLAGLGTAAAKLIYKDGVSYQELLEDENLLEQFVVGALSSGLAQSGGVVNSVKTGTDFISGMTANEETVVNKEAEKRIAQEEESGNKLSNKEKNAIYDAVVNDMDKGYISTDTIEEALGGDTFKAYQDAIKSEEAVKNEFETLGKKENPTLADQARYAELTKQIEEQKANPKSKALKQQLSESAFNLAKDSRLVETYNEQTRRKQAFQADLSKYDAKQAEVVKKAVESGILNNTNRTHEFVDLVAKISADKGVSFDFANNAKIKESGFAVDGATVNGFVTDSGITVNIQSAKALNTVVGHEITHILEGTELYDGLQKAVVEYAKTKGEYDSRLAAITKLYEGKNADVNKELVADLVGDYLFTDSDFIARLSTENRNVFQKIYDEIKYLAKVATAGSKEARQLEKAKRAFEKVYKESKADTKTEGKDADLHREGDKQQSDGAVKYSLREEAPPKETGIAYKVFFVKDGKLYPPMVANPDGAATPMGVWLNADVGTAAPSSKTGRAQVKAGGKGTQGGSGSLAFRPGWHLGDLPRASQFDRVNPETGKKELFPENFVWAEVEYAKDVDYQEEAMSYGYTENGKFRHSYAGLPRLPENGYYRYRTNPNPDTVPWIITGAMRVKRLLSDAEVNKILEENGIPPVHRQGGDVGLDKFGFSDDGYPASADNNNKINEIGLEYDSDSKTVSYSLSSLEDAFDYNKSEEEYWTARNEYANALAQSIAEVKGKPTAEEIAKANRYLDSLFLIHDMIAADKDRLDYEAAVNKSAWVGNSEYGGSIDFSTLCAKRRLFTGTFDAIQNALPDTVLNENDFLQIRNMLLEKELESPCSMCYVEGSRAKHGEYVARFLKDYLKTNPEWKPQIADFTSTTRLEQTRIQHPEAFAAYQQAMNKLAQRKPKEASVRTDYKGEILRDFANNSTVAEKNKNGGVRFNSFSDFEIIHALDCMQVLTDMARVGLNGQSYTKVKEFAEAFGNTGLKINLSLVAKDVDANGKLIMDETNGMKYAEAMDIRNRYSENVGTVIVVFNDAQLKAALADSSIDFVLPFHRSQWKKSQYTMMGLPTQTKDYTMVQNDRITNPATGKPVKLSKLKKTVTYTNDITGETFEIKGNIMPNQYWDFSKSGRENAQRYLDFINANGMTPKFDSVIEKVNGKWVLPDGEVGDGYFKLLIDFKMYDNDGWGAPQKPVTPDFNMPYIQQMLDNYVGGHQAFPVAHDVVDAFVESKKGVKHSLSNGEQKQYGNYNVYGKDIALQEDIAPVREDIQPKAQTAEEMFPDDNEPLSEVDAAAMNYEALWSMTDEDAPPVMEEPYTEDIEPSYISDPLKDKTWEEVGKRNVKAYSFEHPEVRPFFKQAAEGMLTDLLSNTLKGQKIYSWNDGLLTVTGQERWTSDAIAKLRDNAKMSYKDIERGLRAIIAGNGAENNAASKRIELVISEELFNGYIDHTSGYKIPADEDYINLLDEMQNAEANAGSFDSIMEVADELAPPIEEETTFDDRVSEIHAKLVDGKRKIDGYTVYLSRDMQSDGATVTVKQPNGENIRTRIDDGGKYYTNKQLWRIAAEMIAEAEGYTQSIEEDIAPVKETVTEPVTEPVAEEVPENKAIRTVQQRLEAKLENAEKALEELRKKKREYNESIESEIEAISQALNKKKDLNTKVAQNLMKRIIRKEEMRDNINADYEKRIADQQVKVAKLKEEVKSGESPTEQAAMRAELHENMIDNIKSAFAEKGFDFDKVLENAKDLSTFSTVDNTPQRVLEKSLGYKEGKVLADLTVNKVAENETKAIRWLNSITDRKNGLLAQLSKQYKIKPGSKESAAAQMYAEGFYVNENEEIISYNDAELAKDFPDAEVRKNIKGLARDPRIREFYDGALAAINESRARNAYPEIKPLKNYFLHFRAMDDTFSRLGIPFNPNDIKAKDLPTDLNGVTADLKPGQPYFASSMHRKGKRTSFDLLGGIEQYATGASRQIFHIDDIQTLRALRNYVADTFGQAKGLEDLDLMTEEEAEAKIKEVYGAHLSTFAKFLNEEANVIAGKTALTDRGLEGIIGRRGITFLDSLNKQVGANMIGFNISSSLTNLIAPVQAFAKTNKAAFVKAMAQTASNRLKAINGKSDGFMEQSPIAIRRKGADRFARTPWQKVSDMGYVFMSAVDDVSTEIIARAKFNELTKKGMSPEQAHIETDKWVSRLMGDRSLGQQPQLYNSKMLGMFTKFQLEVRNQLDAQFYDTIQEAKLSNEEVKNELERNAKTAAKVTKTFVELAVLQHLFGKAFESVAGYNPAFDIISALIKAFGFDDDEDDDDTFTDNLWEGAQELLGDLPYTSTLTGGRIPISSALPVEQFITGKDSYGNEKSRWETLGEAAPYYLMPGGYGQFKKTSQGLGMFDDDLPIAGSYTDSGNLRFPVAPTLPNIAQAAVFGQYASKNARDYFDNEYAPLKEKQIQEFIDLDIPIKDYRDIREGLKGKDTLGEKVAYIATLDLPIDKKNILVNNAANREEPIDMSDYGEYTDWGEFDYAKKYPDKYAFLQANNITVKQYNKFTDDEKEAWSWAYQNPEKFALSKSIASDVVKYRSYTKALSDITADKDENGKSISGSRKEKVISYINNLDADYGEKIILFKSEYPADDTYNYEIVEYLGSREDITYDEMITILYELGFTVKDGRAYWD